MQNPPTNTPVTGHPTVDAVLSILGAFIVIASTLAVALPKHWPFTQLMARFSSDLKGVLKPPVKSGTLPLKTDTEQLKSPPRNP